MQAVHDFLNGGHVVPPVEVQYVDVVGAELLERGVDGDVQRLYVVAREVRLLGDLLA